MAPHLHFQRLNPRLSLAGTPFTIPTTPQPWRRGQRPRAAAVSSFGLSGTNAHAIVEEAPPRARERSSRERAAHLLTLSAKSEQALAETVARYHEYLERRPTVDLGDVTYTTNVGRAHFPHRRAVVARSSEELCAKLSKIRGCAEAGVLAPAGETRPKVAFLFTGQGSQYAQMGRGLYESEPIFRRAFNEVRALAEEQIGEPVPLDDGAFAAVGIFSLQYALVELWRSWGIEPAVVTGHSVGEFAAACAAGVWSVADATKVVVERTRLLASVPERGGMIAVQATEHVPAGASVNVVADAQQDRLYTQTWLVEGKQKMVEIDQGVCVTGYYLLAECARQAKDLEAQRNYLELARDAACWDSSMTYTPKPNRVIQEAIREVMHEYDYQTVDLPALFKQYLDEELPGRRLFLDYCHLTTEGIAVAMSAAASCVLRSLKGIHVPWYALAGDHIAPAPETEAEASFMAAIHNAHRWQSYDLVRYFCARALRFSPHVAELMLNYIDLQTRNEAPGPMSEAEQQIHRLGLPLIHRYLLRQHDKRLDTVLLEAIVDALEKIGIKSRERLERLRREEHSVRRHDVDLLDPFYCSAARQAQEYEGLTWSTSHTGFCRRYYRAFSPHSRFVFVGEADYAVNLSLTCRLPRAAPQDREISIEVNGKHAIEFDINAQWTTWEFTVPGEDMVEGLNEVLVRWPMPEFRGDEDLRRATSDLCEHRFPQFYPVFGEIHSFAASAVRRSLKSLANCSPQLCRRSTGGLSPAEFKGKSWLRNSIV